MRKAPHVTLSEVEDDLAHYTASVALDEVLGWFAEDGYTHDQLNELATEHAERVMDDYS
jgi:hypothetical protein